MKRVLYIAIFGLLAACSSNKGDIQKAVIERASYDLDCPQEKIQTKLVQDDVFGDTSGEEYIYGASGCDKRQTYQIKGELGEFKVYKEGAAPNTTILKMPTIVKK